MVDVDIRPGGYAIVTLSKEPVNSLDLAAWQALERALDRLEADPSVTGAIFASGLKRDVFSVMSPSSSHPPVTYRPVPYSHSLSSLVPSHRPEMTFLSSTLPKQASNATPSFGSLRIGKMGLERGRSWCRRQYVDGPQCSSPRCDPRFLAKLHGSRLATIAAVRGASPAGGCIIAMCCDHRVMSTTGTIG